jgi:hypothetical protein
VVAIPYEKVTDRESDYIIIGSSIFIILSLVIFVAASLIKIWDGFVI